METTQPARAAKNRRPTILIGFLLVAALVIGCSFYFRKTQAVPVKVLDIKKESITSILNATGKVVSDQHAEISVPVSAQAKEVFVKEGARVAAGTLLALFASDELEGKVAEARESVNQAVEKVRRLQRDYDALVAIFSVGGTSKQSVEDALSALKIARSEVSKTNERLKTDESTRDKLKIRAPFAGFVTARDINPGEWAPSGKAIFVLANSTSRAIEIMVDQSDDGLVKIGQTVELTSDAYPGHSWEESVLEIAPALKKEDAENSIKVRLSYGAKAPDLKLGQQVDAKIRIAHHDNIVKVPFDCIIDRQGAPFVALVKGDLIHFVPVVTGIEDMVSVEVVKGVAPGQRIVIPEGKSLKAGQRVKIY